MRAFRLWLGERVWILFPMACAVVVYAPTLRFGLVWDDLDVLHDPALQKGLAYAVTHGSSVFPSGYFKPLWMAAAWTELQCFGEAAWGWHATEIALHVWTVAGVANLLMSWLDDSPVSRTASMLGATFFAIWPTNIEAVTWASARGHVMAAGFVAWGIAYQLRSLRSGKSRDRWFAAILVLAGLLSQENAVAFVPIAMGNYWLLRHEFRPGSPMSVAKPSGASLATTTRADLQRAARSFLPFVLVSSIYLLLRSIFGTSAIMKGVVPSIDRSSTALLLRAWGFYYRETFLAGPGAPFVSALPTIEEVWPFTILGGMLVGAALATAFASKTRIRRGSLAPFWFVAFLAPAFIRAVGPSVTPVALRYLYPALIGVAIALAQCAALTLHATPWKAAIAAFPFIIVLGAVTLHRERPWCSDLSLWERAAHDYPRSTYAHYDSGIALAERGRIPEAMTEYDIAAWLPGDPDNPSWHHGAFRALANIHYFENDMTLVRTCLDKASIYASPAEAGHDMAISHAVRLLYGPEERADPETLALLAPIVNEAAFDTDGGLFVSMIGASVWAVLDEPVLALNLLKRAASVSPSAPAPREEILRLTRLIEQEPDPVRRLRNEAVDAASRGHYSDAVRIYKRALELPGPHARIHQELADVLDRGGNPALAADEIEPLVAEQENNTAMWLKLGVYRERGGNLRGAIAAFQKAEELDPSWARPCAYEGAAEEMVGDRASARVQYEEFLRREPGDAQRPDTRLHQTVTTRIQSLHPEYFLHTQPSTPP